MNMTYELFGESLNWEKFNLPASLNNPETRTINMIQLGQALNDNSLSPPIKVLVVYNSNPVVTTPNQNKVIKGLERTDLCTIVLEHFMTDTARYADYIFPATTVLENWDILDSWGTPYLHINEPVIEPIGEAKTNNEFFRLLSKEMGLKDDFLSINDIDFVKSVFDGEHDYLKGITFDSMKSRGWAKLKVPDKWMPHVNGNFKTPSGKCMFFRPDMDPPLPKYQAVEYSDEEKEAYPYHMLSVKNTKNFLNSSHANVASLREAEGTPWIDLSEEDGDKLDIMEGDRVKVFNQRGEIILNARRRKKVRPGVVCIPQGFWPSFMEGGRSVNALTNDRLTDMGEGGAFQETRVAIMKL